jgi:hypothetical protein
VLNLTDKLTSKELRGEYTYGGYEERSFKNGEIESIAGVYQAVAETIASVNTNGQGIMVTNCAFTGLDLGMKIEKSPEENLEETTQEGSIEENNIDEIQDNTVEETEETKED